MRAINTTERGWCVTSISFTISKVTVIYQYMYSLCYCLIHLMRFINWYNTSVYKKYVNLLGFIFPSLEHSTYLTNNLHRTLLITKNSNQVLCGIFKGHFLLQTLNLLPFQKLQLFRRSKKNKTPTQRKHWKIGLFWGSADRASYYYNKKVLVYNVYSVNNPYSYGELSICVPLFIVRDTCWGNIFSFSSFLRMKFHISTFLTIFESVLYF